MPTPPPVELTIRRSIAQRLRNMQVFILSIALLAGFAVITELVAARTVPNDPIFDDPATGSRMEVEDKKDNDLADNGTDKVKWPKRDSVRVKDGGTADVGGMPVAVAGNDATIETFDRDRALETGVRGTVFAVSSDGPAKVKLGYKGFTNGYGGDWGDRLKVYRLGDCAEKFDRGCADDAKPLTAVNDAEKRNLHATLESGVYAIAAASSGDSGSFRATPLSVSSSWTAGGASGAFNWSYPIETPTTIGGTGPAVGLDYNSQTVDGRSAVTNNQGSWIGEGFNYEPGYIERRYKSCEDDGHDRKYDQCWAWDNATIMLTGASGDLVKDGDTWRSATDSGAKIERLTGTDNGDNNGEHWKVTTTDGTQYFFGMNQRPGWSAGDPETNSTWTVPVYGDDADEPCHKSTFENSHCDQAWRWNLDYVVDPLGNVVSYMYGKETNYYARGGDVDVNGDSYTRGGYLKSIEYGQRTGDLFSSKAPARVVFSTAERCVPTETFKCEPGDLKDDTADRWPDVPADQICKADVKCEATQVAPSFFTRKLLTGITTEVYTKGTYAKVDTWKLKHDFVSNGDGSRSLWLSRIQRTGHTATEEVSLPPTDLLPVQKENRIDVTGDHISPLVRPRLATVYTDTGGQIDVTYGDQDCAPGDTPKPESNSRKCFPVVWMPGNMDKEFTDWFHKYLVTTVVASDRVGGSPDEVTKYSYKGGAGWRKTKPDGISKKEYLTWGDWRGFGKVTVTESPDTKSAIRTDYTYMRGLHGDKDASGSARTVDVTDSEGAKHRDYDELSGQLLETTNFNGDEVIGKTIASFWRHITATDSHDFGDYTSAYVSPSQERTFVKQSNGSFRETKTDTSFDETYGRVTEIFDHGDVNDAGDDTCRRTWYADNTSKWMVVYEKRSEVVAVGCGTEPNRSKDVLDDTRTAFDSGAYGDAPTKGLATEEQILKSHNGTTADYLAVSRTEYDGYGRAVKVSDALDVTSTVTYVDVDGRTTEVKGTNALGHVESTRFEPLRGQPTIKTDANGKVTELHYDAVGRLAKVWPSFHTNDGVRKPWFTYEYISKENKAPAVVSRYLAIDSKTVQVESVGIFDGWMRQRQVQTPAPEGKRIIGDTYYDGLGRVTKVNDSHAVTGVPDPTDLRIVDDGELEGQTITEYDNAGRVTAEIFADQGNERWRTEYVYQGETTVMIPPEGSSATATIVDAAGQITEQRQFQSRQASGTYDATKYDYTPGGLLEKVRNSTGSTWSYEYDQRGRKIVSHDPDSGDSSYVYDDLDQLTSTTDARGSKLSTVYDKLGRVTSTWEGEPESGTKLSRNRWDVKHLGYLHQSYSFSDGFELSTRVKDRDWNYAPLDTQYVVSGAAAGKLAGTYNFGLAYNPDGTVAYQSWPDAGGLTGPSLTYEYDNLRRLKSISGDDKTWLSSVEYSLTGLLSQVRYPVAGTTLEQNFQYEHGSNRLSRTWVRKDNTQGAIADIHNTYDQSGNVLSTVDEPTLEGGVRDAQCFEYDDKRRLTEAWTSAASGTKSSEVCAGGAETTGVGGAAPYWQSYGFDAAGNRTSVTTRETADAEDGTTNTYSYPAAGEPGAHQISEIADESGATSTYRYDDAGNTISVDRSGSLQTLTWNAVGKVSSVSQGDNVVSYIYDAEGNQVLRTDSTGKTLSLPGMELHEDTSGNVKATQNIELPGGLTAVRTNSGTQYQLADRNGTGTIGFNGTTGKVDRRYTDPYGNARGTAPNEWSGQRGFVGGLTDAATGYLTLGARQYDPVTGKFLSVDPIIDPADPQQLNPYTYATGNPVTFNDASGLMYWDGAGTSSGGGASVKKPSGGDDGRHLKKEYEKRGLSHKDVDWANQQLDKSMFDVIVEAGGQILLDLIGYTDAKACVGDGDIGACVSLAIDVIPWSKVFSVGKKLWKAGKRIIGAIKGYKKATSRAKDIMEKAASARKAASKKAKKETKDLEKKSKEKGDEKPEETGTSCNSFTSAARVVMADGSTKPIAKVEIGDEVKSTDVETGETTSQKVIGLPRTGDEDHQVERELVTITVNTTEVDTSADDQSDGANAKVRADGDEEDIIATAGHAFWTNDKPSDDSAQWTPARDIASGAWLRTSSGTWIQITAVEAFTTETNTYNLTVANEHNYHVLASEAEVLVHNERCEYSQEPGSRPGKKFTKWGKNKTWKNSAENDGIVRCMQCGVEVVKPVQHTRGVRPPDEEGHVDHIVPQSRGGSGDPSNGQILCRVCNIRKSNSMDEDG